MAKEKKKIDYAIYDTQDKCWLGTEKGVKTWPDEEIVRAAATVVTEQFKVRLGRFRALPYYGDAKKFKDELTAEMTVLEALKRLEDGKI